MTLDGLHFDDYFYPIPKAVKIFDEDPFRLDSLNKADWRRNNVNMVIVRAAKTTQ